MLMKLAISALLAAMPLSMALADEGPQFSSYSMFAVGHTHEAVQDGDSTGQGAGFAGGVVHYGSIYNISSGWSERGFQARIEIDRAAVHLACDPDSNDGFCVRLEASVDGKYDDAGKDNKVNFKAYVTPTVRFTDDDGQTIGFGVSAGAGAINGSQFTDTPTGVGGGLLLFIDTSFLNIAANGDYLSMSDSKDGLKSLMSGALNFNLPLTRNGLSNLDLSIIGRAQILKSTERNRDILFGGGDRDNVMELRTFIGLGGTIH